MLLMIKIFTMKTNFLMLMKTMMKINIINIYKMMNLTIPLPLLNLTNSNSKPPEQQLI